MLIFFGFRFSNIFVSPIAKIKEDVGHRHATWIELFYDLVFVISMARLTEFLVEHLLINGFLSFLLLFVPVWWAWVGSISLLPCRASSMKTFRKLKLIEHARLLRRPSTFHHQLLANIRRI
ncbi:MAG: hypothetical protein COT91_01445 [Candidatus Doudnabacteria bacterium CG10_big_fil_rev_8_21_14_0_10_41_10]|uniref:Uncharacterized protein n=1 Tax=Candidatus Doudnabacteria bacterium CG10_big_fil_rev_8_21_14_0_10_41_10 TaxID=1974551 RepID=A0A2H0VEC1_9BACT|nr:MAG: hypothetical protein COT91_01445 [Candidatus Doudnabacteria bacterium CG10_big_fil_rev_8_21_14_0_10_41_10]